MSKKKWLIVGVVAFVCVGIGVAVVLELAFGFLGERREAAAADPALPIYKVNQTASTHAGYRHNTMTCGTNVFVNDYEEAGLQLTTTEPTPVVGCYEIGQGKVCGVPGQPVSDYIAGDVGSEMSAYVPYRNINHPAFDWRTATFREMRANRPGWRNQYITTTNSALLSEVVRNLREGILVVLPAFPFAGVTNVTTLNMASDQLPGMLFCPSVYVAANGTIYLAESLMFDTTTSGTDKLTARWVPASPTLTTWLKSP